VARKAGVVIHQDQPHRMRYFTIPFAIIGGLLFAIAIVAALKLSNFGSANLHAFVTPSNSICPTLCAGERVLADLAAYSTRSPERGEVILFAYEVELTQ
jgi:signal peptidase I